MSTRPALPFPPRPAARRDPGRFVNGILAAYRRYGREAAAALEKAHIPPAILGRARGPRHRRPIRDPVRGGDAGNSTTRRSAGFAALPCSPTACCVAPRSARPISAWR